MDSSVKAQEIVDEFYNSNDDIQELRKDKAKECALIDINNTLDVLRGIKSTKETLEVYRFYLEVKIKIEKI